MNARIYRLSPRVIGALASLVDRLVSLREAAQYGDLDLDGRDLDIGVERAPTWEEKGEEGCWCIRKSRDLGGI